MPLYNHKDPNLVLEYNIAALERSCVHEREFQEEQEETKKQEMKKALEEEEGREAEKENGGESVMGSAKDSDTAATPKASAQESLPSQVPSRVPSFTTLLVPSQVSSKIGPRTGPHASPHARPAPGHQSSSSSTNIPRIGAVEAPSTQAFPSISYTPHDRGHYLAYSAPGSRHASVDNTPFVSRSVSPTHLHGLSVRGGHGNGHGSLRPIASTSRLNQLLAEEGFRRSSSPLTDVTEGGGQGGERPHWEERDEDMVANLSVSQGWMDPDDISAFVGTVSRRPSPSRPSSRSRPLSRVNTCSPRPNSHSPNSEEMTEGGLYLHGLGHPDVLRDDVSKAQTRESSPFRVPNYQSAESAAYLRGLATRHYDIVNAGLGFGSNTSAGHEGSSYPEASSTRSQTPIGHPPTGLFGSSVFATSQHRDTTPVFTFPAPRQPDTFSFPAYIDPVPSPSYITHTDKKPKPLNTGRPRAASKALNEAYNAANPSPTPRPGFPSLSHPPDEHTEINNTATDTEDAVFTSRCPIHSESCNGHDVVHEHITERARNGAGFKDLFPTITCDDGRVMVDWARMKNEEVEKLRG